MQNFENSHIYLYNSRIIDIYIKLIRRKYNFIDVSQLLDSAGMTFYEVADQGHWFTQEQIDNFYKKLVELTGNPSISREAGRYAASPDASGIMGQYFLSLIGPARAYEMLRKGAANFTRSATYESKRIASNKVEIVVTPHSGVSEKPFQCENRLGFFEAISNLFDYNTPHIEHPECIFKGDTSCRYVISWDIKSSALRKLRKSIVILFTIVCIILSIFKYWLPLHIAFSLAAVIIPILAFAIERREKHGLIHTLETVKQSAEETIEQINTNYNNALITNEIGQAISKQMQIEDILSNVIQVLENRLDYDRGLILLADNEKTKLVFQTGFGYTDEQANLLRKTTFHLRPESKGVFVLSFREQKPFLINNLNEIESSLSSHSLAFAKKMGTQSFICCPIICEGDSLGVLAVDNIKTKKAFIQSDVSLLMGIAPVIGISIHNANLIEARVQQFESIIKVMAASIDARDNLTAGHSERVTEYAVGICEELKLSDDYCEMIRVASLLHDYGKLGVPDAILKKPGRLTDREHNIVKSHAAKTRELLEEINFDGIFWQVPEIAGSHHEKVDGSGYPNGLKGKDIPLGAKIIAVADFFEAITSKRHYREPMPVDVAIGLLQNNIGTHFEGKIVRAFVDYLHKYKLCLLEKSQRKFRDRLQRLPCNVPVFICAEGVSKWGSSVDISPTGVYVATDIEIETGSEVELSLAEPVEYDAFYSAKGRVAWVNTHDERRKTSFPIGFGVEFVKTSNMGDAPQAFIDLYHHMTWSSQEDNSLYEKVS